MEDEQHHRDIFKGSPDLDAIKAQFDKLEALGQLQLTPEQMERQRERDRKLLPEHAEFIRQHRDLFIPILTKEWHELSAMEVISVQLAASWFISGALLDAI